MVRAVEEKEAQGRAREEEEEREREREEQEQQEQQERRKMEKALQQEQELAVEVAGGANGAGGPAEDGTSHHLSHPARAAKAAPLDDTSEATVEGGRTKGSRMLMNRLSARGNSARRGGSMKVTMGAKFGASAKSLLHIRKKGNKDIEEGTEGLEEELVKEETAKEAEEEAGESGAKEQGLERVVVELDEARKKIPARSNSVDFYRSSRTSSSIGRSSSSAGNDGRKRTMSWQEGGQGSVQGVDAAVGASSAEGHTLSPKDGAVRRRYWQIAPGAHPSVAVPTASLGPKEAAECRRYWQMTSAARLGGDLSGGTIARTMAWLRQLPASLTVAEVLQQLKQQSMQHTDLQQAPAQPNTPPAPPPKPSVFTSRVNLHDGDVVAEAEEAIEVIEVIEEDEDAREARERGEQLRAHFCKAFDELVGELRVIEAEGEAEVAAGIAGVGGGGVVLAPGELLSLAEVAAECDLTLEWLERATGVSLKTEAQKSAKVAVGWRKEERTSGVQLPPTPPRKPSAFMSKSGEGAGEHVDKQQEEGAITITDPVEDEGSAVLQLSASPAEPKRFSRRIASKRLITMLLGGDALVGRYVKAAEEQLKTWVSTITTKLIDGGYDYEQRHDGILFTVAPTDLFQALHSHLAASVSVGAYDGTDEGQPALIEHGPKQQLLLQLPGLYARLLGQYQRVVGNSLSADSPTLVESSTDALHLYAVANDCWSMIDQTDELGEELNENKRKVAEQQRASARQWRRMGPAGAEEGEGEDEDEGEDEGEDDGEDDSDDDIPEELQQVQGGFGHVTTIAVCQLARLQFGSFDQEESALFTEENDGAEGAKTAHEKAVEVLLLTLDDFLRSSKDGLNQYAFGKLLAESARLLSILYLGSFFTRYGGSISNKDAGTLGAHNADGSGVGGRQRRGSANGKPGGPRRISAAAASMKSAAKATLHRGGSPHGTMDPSVVSEAMLRDHRSFMQGLEQFEEQKEAKAGGGARQGRIELGLQPIMDVVMMLTMPVESMTSEWFTAVLQSYPPSVRRDPAPVLAATQQVLMIRPDVGTATQATAVVQGMSEGSLPETQQPPKVDGGNGQGLQPLSAEFEVFHTLFGAKEKKKSGGRGMVRRASKILRRPKGGQ
jgi:hypothetical protein